MASTYYIDLLTVGEVGEANVDIRESVVSLQYELSADLVSQIKFTVHDPDFEMYNRNYFAIGRRVVYNGVEFEIAAVALIYQSLSKCEVTARTKSIQEMRRDVSRVSLGNVSPTQIAARAAAEFGLGFYGEASAANGTVVRQETDGVTESTYEVLQRLARDLQFRVFETKGVLMFASERDIVDFQPRIFINIPPESDEPFYVVSMNVRKTVDGKKPATIQLNLLKNESTIQMFPGMGMLVNGINGFEYPFMLDRISFDANPNGLVQVSGTSVVSIEEINCTKQVFKRGSSGDCVKRIQSAIGAKVDGDFGPQTERLLKRFQTDSINQGLLVFADGETYGIVGPGTWSVIINV